jgi:hypothetical protein
VTIPVLADDVDADGDPLSVTDVSDPAHGSVTIQPDGTVVYTPDPGYIGDDSFTYTVCDDNGECTSGTVTITVNPPVPFPPPSIPPTPPVAHADSASTPFGTAVMVPVGANDTDADDDLDVSTVRVVTDPAHGTTTVAPGGNVQYTPEAGYAGADTFAYEICDATDECDQASVAITVDPAEVNAGLPPEVEGGVAPSVDPASALGAPGTGTTLTGAAATIETTAAPGGSGTVSLPTAAAPFLPRTGTELLRMIGLGLLLLVAGWAAREGTRRSA